MNNKIVVDDNTFFTSDTHFYHNAMITKGIRYFNSVSDMNDVIVSCWNKYVKPTDTVIHLGDFSFGGKREIKEILSRLNGRIILVRGNHDHTKNLRIFKDYGIDIYDILRITHKDQYIIASHYPMLTWDKAHYGSWHIHGHCHGNLPLTYEPRVDLSWDVYQRPIHISELYSIFVNRKYTPIDHHS